jgi:KDO2-lipid IV(A) lauroyltransferase
MGRIPGDDQEANETMIRSLYFYLVISSLNVLSKVPLRLLRRFSPVIYFFLHRIIRYRSEIVDKNLKNSLPERDEQERKVITQNFYRYFSRLLMENIKLSSLSPDQLSSQIKLTNPELITGYFSEGRSVAAIAAHYGNWEWLLGLKKDVPHQTLGIYKPQNNKNFDNFLVSQRSRYGTRLVSMREVPRVLLEYHRSGTPTLTLFISDQSPVWEEIQYWTPFLNQQTAVYLGPEKLASRFKMAVIYFRVKVFEKHYEVEAVPIIEDASKAEPYEITRQYIKLLEEDIRRKPEYWLWTHRRWKLTERRIREESRGIYRFDGPFKRSENG